MFEGREPARAGANSFCLPTDVRANSLSRVWFWSRAWCCIALCGLEEARCPASAVEAEACDGRVGIEFRGPFRQR
eukprot:4824691-Lingulodinium_polyedra.AAC.1